MKVSNMALRAGLGVIALLLVVLLFSGCTDSADLFTEIKAIMEEYDNDGVTETISRPTDLTATATDYSTIELTWTDNSDNEVAFKLYRNSYSSIYNISTNDTITIAADLETYTDTGLTDQTDYNYYIYAVNDEGNESIQSDLVNVTIEAAPTHTVTYDVNAGGRTVTSVPSDDTDYYKDDTVTVLAGNTMIHSGGATFHEWNTDPDGYYESYLSGDTFSMPNYHVTLYAQWTTETTYTVTYDGNGDGDPVTGVPTDENNYLEYNQFTVKGSGDMARSGYTFVRWDTQADGNGNSFNADEVIDLAGENWVLYAVWQAGE